MLPPILISHHLPIGHELLKGRIDHNLLGDGVAGEFPDELVLPARLRVFVLGGDDVAVLPLQLGVVVLDAVRDADAGRRRHEGADVDGGDLEGAGDACRGHGRARDIVGDATRHLAEGGVGGEAIHDVVYGGGGCLWCCDGVNGMS